MNDLILYQEDVEKLDSILLEFVTKTSALCTLLTSKEGQLLACQGQTDDIDTVSVAALITGSFSATVSIANLVGESEFKTMLHHGANKHIQITLVDKDRYLATLFSNAVSIETINHFVEPCCVELRNYLAFISGNEQSASLPTLDFASPQAHQEITPTPSLSDEPSDLVDSFEAFRSSMESPDNWEQSLPHAQQPASEDEPEDQIIVPEIPIEEIFHLDVEEDKTVAEDIVEAVTENPVFEVQSNPNNGLFIEDEIAPPSKTAYLRIKIEEAKAYQKHKSRNDIISKLVGKRKQRKL